MGDTVRDPELLERVSRDVLAAVAPEELPLLPATVESFVARDGRLPHGRTVEDRLGFGVAEAVVMIGPTVVMIVSECLKTVVSEATKGATGAVHRRLATAVRRRRPADPDPTPDPTPAVPGPLSDEERDRIRDVARSAALRGGLTGDRVDTVVEAVLDALPGASSR